MSDKFISPNSGEMDPQKTVDVKNPKAKELVKQYLSDKTADNLNALLNELHNCNVLIPATVGPNKQPIPVLFGTNDGGKVLPIFLDVEEVEAKPDMKIPVLVNVPYPVANKMGADPNVEIIGIAVNPFTDNLIFKRQLLEQVIKVDEERAKHQAQGVGEPQKVTEDQYNIIHRKQFEFGVLPIAFYSEGQAFVDELVEKKSTFIDERFEASYQDQRMYPFLEEEFPVMVMDISEELLVVSVDMPSRYYALPDCLRIYFTWDKVKQEGHYYTIEYTDKKDVHLLGEITKEKNHVSHGAAPVEGAELQTIIDLHNHAHESES